MFSKFIITVGLFLASINTAEAKFLYISPTGNDSTTYAANDSNNPWLTPCRASWGASCAGASNAAQAAQPDDIVIFLSGVYTVPGTGTRFTPAMKLANSGTSGHYIEYKCNIPGPSEACEIRLSSSSGPVLGCGSLDFVKFRGFYIDGILSPSTSDTGYIDIAGSAVTESCEVYDSKIRGDINHPGGDNHNGIRIENALNAIVQNTWILDIGTDGTVFSGNEAAIMMYDSNGTLIENNKFGPRVGNATYVKGIHPGFEQAGTVIRKNLGVDIRYSCLDSLGDHGSQKYQNICIAGTPTPGENLFGSLIFALIAGSPGNVTITNNLFIGFNQCQNYEGAGGDPDLYENIKFYNNICADGVYGPASESLTVPGDTVHQHNVYWSQSSNVAFFGSSRNLSSWQTFSTPNQDTTSPQASTSDPQFVNYAGGDYHLQPGSYALTLGRAIDNIINPTGTTQPAGPYVTGDECIGLLSECSDSDSGVGGWILRRKKGDIF